MEKYVLKSDFIGSESDLAAERRRADLNIVGVEFRRDKGDIGSWERLRIRSEEGARSIGRPIGIYDTLTLPYLCEMDCDEIDDACNEIAKELCRICDVRGICPERILVVGLGNRDMTPDSVGCRCADMTRATRHIKAEDARLFYSLECSEISVIKPGTRSESGIDAATVVKGVCDSLHPDVVIAIDALAAGSPARLGNTIQVCDTGIHPGSGLGNRRGALNEELLGAPVIAIGVPTVINSRLFVVENGEARAPSRGEGLFLSPQTVSETVTSAARIIAGGINQAFGLSEV